MAFLYRASIRQLYLAGAIVLCAAFVSVGVATWQLRDDAIEDSVRDVRNVALMLSAQIERSIQAVDTTLIDLLKHVALAGVEDDPELKSLVRSEYFQTLLKESKQRLPQVSNISVYDAAGRSIVTTFATTATVDISDRDYFRELKASNTTRLVITLPMVNRFSGVSNVVLARSIASHSGEFLGIMLIPLPLSYFESVYAPIQMAGDLLLTLARTDGTVILRYPEPYQHAGRKLPDGTPWYDIVDRGGGGFRSPGHFDNVPRWVAVRLLRDYPLVLGVGISESAVLARWYQRSVYIIAGAIALLSCAAYLLWAAGRQVHRVARSEARLRDKSDALEVSNMRFDSALNNISQGLCMFDADRRVVVSNARYAEIYQLSPDDVVPGTSLEEILTIRLGNGTYSGRLEQDYLKDSADDAAEVQELPDGRAIQIRRHRMADGGWMTTHEDITDRHRNQTQIAFMARHDLLTGLYNRATFAEKIEEARARLRRFGEVFSILLLDLDRFKQVNDTLGHPAGDVLLQQTAERLAGSLRDTDTLARFGGDEFAVILTGGKNQRDDAVAFASRIINCLSQPYDLAGQTISVSTSIGIALAPEHGTTPDDLVRYADLALYRAKADGRNGFSIFDSTLMDVANARQQMEIDLREAISKGEFELHYQPIVDVRTRRVCGAEALVRWRHPRRGLVPPMDFIPLAEETGQIEAIGRWVMRQACREATTWPADTKVAVNLSPAQFGKSNLIGIIEAALAESGLPAHRLEVEITESVFLAGAESNIAVVRRMKEMGISIALDDFGTGYSSLSYLTTFPFDKVKIDKTFITNMTKRSECAAVIASVITLSRCLDVTTTAEGVESRQQLELLRAAGVTHCQGYLFGRPCPAADLSFTKVAFDDPAGTMAAA